MSPFKSLRIATCLADEVGKLLASLVQFSWPVCSCCVTVVVCFIIVIIIDILKWPKPLKLLQGPPFGMVIVPGSRAVVFECQFGPRRKKQVKKTAETSLDASSSVCGFRHSCPARYDARELSLIHI